MRQSKSKACSSDSVRDVPIREKVETGHESHERVVERGARRWTVREVNAAAVPGAAAPRCLICESDDVVRRIWRYPDNWLGLSDDDLLRICDKSFS
jgi:hypothetical protein